jgi:hypothetical protein
MKEYFATVRIWLNASDEGAARKRVEAMAFNPYSGFTKPKVEIEIEENE